MEPVAATRAELVDMEPVAAAGPVQRLHFGVLPVRHAPGASAAIGDLGSSVKLHVTMIRATNLKHLNFLGDNPWCLCEVKHAEHRSRPFKCNTKSLSKTLDPVWNETHEINDWHVGEALEFSVMDSGIIGSKLEGRVTVPSQQFYPHGFEGELPLSGVEHSTLGLRIVVAPPETQVMPEASAQQRTPEHSQQQQQQLDQEQGPPQREQQQQQQEQEQQRQAELSLQQQQQEQQESSVVTHPNARPSCTSRDTTEQALPNRRPLASSSRALSSERSLRSTHLVTEGVANGSQEEDNDLEWVVWTPDDVGDWVDAVCGEQLGALFRNHKIDGPKLLELSDDDLQVTVGVMNPLHRQKISSYIRVFQLRRTRLVHQALRRRRVGSVTSPIASPRDASLCGNGSSSRRKGSPALPRPGGAAASGQIVQAGGYPAFQPSFHSGRVLSDTWDKCSTSVDSRRVEDDPHTYLATNRHSRYTNPNKMATVGLTSHFGLDSPSYSLRGSFSTAPRRTSWASPSPRHSATSIAAPPGPASYTIQTSKFAHSPRSTIGKSPRNTSEFLVNTNMYVGDHVRSLSPSRVKGGVIGNAIRWKPTQGRNSPGPCHYRPREGFSSRFK